MLGMEPEYTVIPVVQTSHADPGETIRIFVYISGWGDVEQKKLNVIHDHPEIVLEESPGELRAAIQDGRDKMTGEYIEPATGENYLQTHDMDETGAYIGLGDSFFKGDSRHNYTDWIIPFLLAEEKHDNYPPVEYRLNTREDATPGDYNITFCLTYSKGEEVDQSSKEVTVHVNSWPQQHRTALAIIGALGTFVAIGGLLVSAGII